MEDALKYEFRGDWKNNSSSIYSTATRKKELFKIATAHMKPKWFRIKRQKPPKQKVLIQPL